MMMLVLVEGARVLVGKEPSTHATLHAMAVVVVMLGHVLTTMVMSMSMTVQLVQQSAEPSSSMPHERTMVVLTIVTVPTAGSWYRCYRWHGIHLHLFGLFREEAVHWSAR